MPKAQEPRQADDQDDEDAIPEGCGLDLASDTCALDGTETCAHCPLAGPILWG